MSLETSFWTWLKKANGLQCSVQRIENIVMNGMPDVWFTLENDSGMLELKTAKRPIRGGPLNIAHQESQFEWHEDIALSGFRKSGWLIRVEKSVYGIKSSNAALLKQKVTENDLARHNALSTCSLRQRAILVEVLSW